MPGNNSDDDNDVQIKDDAGFRIFYAIVQTILAPMRRWLFGIRRADRIDLPTDGACLVLVNHSCFFDPIIVGEAVRQPIHFVAAEHMFYKGIPKLLLSKMLQCIPCAKGASNVETVYAISKHIKAGHAVCLFAEGNISYDGATAPMVASTGKLVRVLHCPVVTMRLHGACQIMPRWSREIRPGHVRCEIVHEYDKDAFRGRKPEEILETLNADLYLEQPFVRKIQVDNVEKLADCQGEGKNINAECGTAVENRDGAYTASKGMMHGAKSDADVGQYAKSELNAASDTNADILANPRVRRSAKGIGFTLYACPKCGALGRITGRGRDIICEACGDMLGRLDDYGAIADGSFRTIYEWNRWQRGYMEELVRGGEPMELSLSGGRQKPDAANRNADGSQAAGKAGRKRSNAARLNRIIGGDKRVRVDDGDFLLNRDRLSCGETSFALDDILQMDTRNKGIVLFSLADGEYFEVRKKGGYPGLMYKTLFEILKQCADSILDCDTQDCI